MEALYHSVVELQPLCTSKGRKNFVADSAVAQEPIDAGAAGLWTKAERVKRGLSADDLKERINGLARENGDPTTVSQQVVSKYEQGKTKKKPAWTRYIAMAFAQMDGETREDPYLDTGKADNSVMIRLLPTHAGMGGGGSGEGDEGEIAFSRDLIERELRAPPDALLAMVAEGNSMAPDFMGGDQILVDTRKRSLAQPGAFCLWDSDGHVIKYLERIPNSEPPRVRIISANRELFEPYERLVEEVSLIGRVIWYGRRVQ
ncbi:LexA family transcriptional regulator [Stakelama pacifica]|uniref:Phage repressor protein C with HTH and peptisase S24 domain n=1 Tax=Stakelama pacifica TaxID=517720 RepID=A0A4R6FM88_9SPHN|nr:LexA family transcriptional regulator [Stakelama pacifica]TDN81745.1 phage repressor protein C with HTH and peptisase S24 domain [Stakelama pacifica]GGO96442.1 hypothetical protein GCM10011329_22980 [Stakelama pacifica]